jgi:hypothetical protein
VLASHGEPSSSRGCGTEHVTAVLAVRRERRGGFGFVAELRTHGRVMQPPAPIPLGEGSLSMAAIKREYLDDLKCRGSATHYKNVKSSSSRARRMERVIGIEPTTFSLGTGIGG